MSNIPENIIFLKGDVLKTETDIVCHQVNCKGVMGSGIAKQIRALYPDVYTGYVSFSKKHSRSTSDLLGCVYFHKTDNYVIANCYGQDAYGINRRHTDYKALEMCFQKVKNYAQMNHFKTISMPYKIGCGLAGGDWNIVLDMIVKMFGNSDITVKIVEWNR